MQRISRRFVVKTLARFCCASALVLAIAASRRVAASRLDFSEFPCPSNSALTCVMDGLHNPRGIAFGPEGALYVAEAGCGGGGSDCQDSAPLSSCVQLLFDGNLVTQCLGLTGSISRLWNGVQERVATGLPSVAFRNGSNATGPTDVSLLGVGNLYAIIGLRYDPTARSQFPPLGPLFAQLVHVPASAIFASSDHTPFRTFNTEWLVADIGSYEATTNPDTGDLDSNPYGLLVLPDGWIVADAGGNSLLKIDRQRNTSLLAAFQSRGSTPPRSSFAAPPLSPVTDAVPTAVVVGPDGAYYVSELTGVPFVNGTANVYRIVPGEVARLFLIEDAFLTGFKMIIDMAFDDDGNLYVLEHATGAVQQTGLGVLIRVTPDKNQPDIFAQYRNGTRTTVMSGLFRPMSVAVGPDGNLYISRGTTAGGGEVIRFEPPAP
jgi:hypothetical protein